MDFITKLPPSQGFNLILTVTDHSCTKAVRFIPCNEAITAEGTAQLFLQKVFCHYGLPTKIISDQDPRFTSRFTKELCRLLSIQQNISTAYHPQTDGQSERNNQWVETYLQFFVNHQQNNWAEYLPLTEFAHNNWRSETTRESPFFLLMGYHPRADWHRVISDLPLALTCLDQIKKIRDDAQHHMTRAQNLWIKHKTMPKYREGDQVWLEGCNLHIDQPATKLAPQRHGPFTVVQVMSPVSYRLDLPLQWKIHPVFHIDLLSPYCKTEVHGVNYQHPPPELIDNEEEYKVETILDSRRTGRGRKLQYLIKWKGYPNADNQWEDYRNVTADDLVHQFQRCNPTKETHLR
jgi:transposase InsO family protein